MAMKDSIEIINPLKVKQEDLPLIVLCDDRRSFFGWFIKSHSKGNYNHIMEFSEPGQFVSQDPAGYREVDVETYMKPFILMKFWSYENITEAQKKCLHEIIEADLNAPWRFRSYDWLGLVGQLLHIKWLQNPHKRYCSERVAEHLRFVFKIEIPKHPTPSGINSILENIPGMKIQGYWFEH